jgi:CHAT domain-containing protein
LGSYSQHFPYNCENGHSGRLEVWLVVDGAERPDLFRLAAAGEFTPPRCPVCGADAGVAGPLSLLLYRPGQRPELLFGSTSPPDDPRRGQQAAISGMVFNRGRDQPFDGTAIQVPYELLTVMAERDMEDDADALDGGTFSAPSAELQQYAEFLSGYAFERFKQASWPALIGLLQANGAAAVREVIEASPVLLDQRCDALLAQVAETAEEEGEPQMAHVARERRDLLRRVSELGIDQAFGPAQPPPVVHAKIADRGPATAESADAGGAGTDDGAESVGTLSPAVGAALLAMAGIPVGDPPAPVTEAEQRQLLERALAEMTPGEGELAMEFQPGELVSLRDLMSNQLAGDLAGSPRDRIDLLRAQRLLQGLDHLRDTAPHAWAMARHNSAVVAARLASPGDLAALDAARADFELALTVRTSDTNPEDWAETLVALANLLRDDYPGQDPRYLDRSVAMMEEALADPPPGRSGRSRLMLLVTLASGLLRQGERRGDAAALRRAADNFAEVIAKAEGPGNEEIRRVARANSGMALSLLAERTGQPDDWRAAVARLREALADAVTGTVSQWVAAAINLSIALRHAGDIEAAIPLMRQTLERTAAAEMWSAWASTQNNLGNALLDRTEGDRDENIDQAIAAYDGARRVWTGEKFPIEWALTTARMAVAYEATADGRARAGELLREAVALVPRAERPVDWARVANRLASFESPEAAIARYGAAAEVLNQADFPHEWASIQHNLGGLYRRLAREAGSEADAVSYLAAAADRFRGALAVRPVSEAPLLWAETSMSLASTLRDLSARHETGSGNQRLGPDYRAEAERIYAEALHVLQDGGPAERMIQTAAALGVMLAEDGKWADAARALSAASDAADHLYAANLLRRSREQTISQHNWLSAALAYCLIQLDRPADAVRALEHGRARMLWEVLARDPDRVAAARETHPEQYAAYLQAGQRLDAAEAASARLLAAASAAAGGSDTYHQRAEQAARDELRAARAAFQEASSRLPELSPPPGEQVAGSVTSHLFTSGRDGWALLTWPDRVQSLRLPDIDESTLRQLANALVQAQAGDRRELRAVLDSALGVLGPRVLAPMATALRAGRAAGVTLVPIGLFGAFPLHAAPVDSTGRCLLDDLAVSYAPSAMVLAEARQSARHRADGRQRAGLAIVDPDAGLAFAGPEADAMARWTGGHRVEAAAGNVLDQLANPAVTHVHFACHGQSLADRPLQSYLALGHGRRLTVLDLLAGHRPELLRGARVVVASACQTAVTDMTRTPDEFVGLGAGFLAAGVPCFVGTLWSADDIPAALVMSRFYELLAGDGLPAGEAMRHAQRWLRDLDGRGLHEYLTANPGLAAVRPGLAALAESRPDQRFYTDPVSWSPYVVIGDAR